MMDQSSFPYYKYAFFSAFTTVNHFRHPGDFFIKDIAPLFTSYSGSLSDISAENKAGDSNDGDPILFQPVPYCLFGDFDLAVFSLIDDFGFGTKKFKPAPETKVFKYQVNTGIIPLIDVYKGAPHLESFKKDRIPDFFTGKQRYPFTGIAAIKLNNDMLVGIGQDILELMKFFLVTYIDFRIQDLNPKKTKLFYIINENLGWNELTIYFFGNSMAAIQNLIFRIRSFSLQDIKDFLENLPKDQHFDQDLANAMVKKSLMRIGKDSLLADLVKEEQQGRDFLSSHPFIATSLAYGYHVELADKFPYKKKLKSHFKFSDAQLHYFEKQCHKRSVSIGWKIKPGHEHHANRTLKKIFKSVKEDVFTNVLSGKYPFRFPKDKVTMAEYLAMDKAFVKKVVRDELAKHIIKSRSRIRWSSGIKYAPFKDKDHYFHDLEKYQIQPGLIVKIQDSLRAYPIPYTFKSQIENLIINFNDAIMDPLMHNYFIGLKGSLLNFLKSNFKTDIVKPDADELLLNDNVKRMLLLADTFFTIPEVGNEDRPIKPKPVEIVNISLFIQTWNKAYWNRYFHSYYFTEINDFNIEHHGGIQQILFSYDVVYKLISKRIFGKRCKRPFINVQIGPEISSTQYYNTVNFIHLFAPAIYACEIVHEVSNYIIPSLIEDGFDNLDLLMNPKNEAFTGDRLDKLEQLEEKIYNSVGPRDDFEIRYIRDRFGLNTSRHIIADFITFKFAYQNDNKGDQYADIDKACLFYHTHWFQLLIRADLYARESEAPESEWKGAWFFMEDEFKALFIRFNLMFYICFGYQRDQLLALNEKCPSVELKPFWESEKISLIDFVIRLGNVFTTELKGELTKEDAGDLNGFELLIDTIKTRIIQEGWASLDSQEKGWYEQAFKINEKIIHEFSSQFQRDDNRTNFNIIKRMAKNRKLQPSGRSTNVEFYKNNQQREVFLDPKGNIFSASPEIRKTIYQSNVLYIKRMWDLSLHIIRKDYKEAIYG